MFRYILSDCSQLINDVVSLKLEKRVCLACAAQWSLIELHSEIVERVKDTYNKDYQKAVSFLIEWLLTEKAEVRFAPVLFTFVLKNILTFYTLRALKVLIFQMRF